MDQYVLRGKIKGYFKTKKGLILALIVLLLVSLGISVVLVKEPQILEKFARGPRYGKGICRWHRLSGAGDYRYVIKDETADKVIVQGITEELLIKFEGAIDHTYSCTVFGVNECGLGPEGKDTKTCGQEVTPIPSPSLSPPPPTPTVTLTPTVIPTVTPTLPPGVTPTVTPTETPSLTPTVPIESPTPTITPSATGGPTPTPTATPTLAPGITPTETPTPAVTPQPTATPVPTATAAPTTTPTSLARELPESGFFTLTYLLFVSGVVSILGGMLLLRIF